MSHGRQHQVIVNETLNRCHRSLPPVTPELVEKTCILLGINTAKQHLIARLSTTRKIIMTYSNNYFASVIMLCLVFKFDI